MKLLQKYFQLLAPSKSSSCSHSKFLLLLQSFYGAQFLSEAMTPKSGDYNPFSHRIVVKTEKSEAQGCLVKFWRSVFDALQVSVWMNKTRSSLLPWTNKSNIAKLSFLFFSQLSSVLSSVHRDIYRVFYSYFHCLVLYWIRNLFEILSMSLCISKI